MRISLVLSILMTITAAQAQQNPALTGEPLAGLTGPVPQVNPFETEAGIQQGAALFQTHCSYCHGAHGEGGRGADLTAGEYRMGGSDRELFKTVRIGVPGSEMPAARVSDDEIWKLVGYVKRLGSRGLSEKAPGNALAGEALYARNGCAAPSKCFQIVPVEHDVDREMGI